jgi:transposase-like protein
MWQSRGMQRKHRTPAQREEILERYHRSGLSQNQFASHAGLSLATLNGWLRRASAKKSPFPALVQIPNLLSAAPIGAYRLRLPSGVALEVPPGFKLQEVSVLLQLVKVL